MLDFLADLLAAVTVVLLYELFAEVYDDIFRHFNILRRNRLHKSRHLTYTTLTQPKITIKITFDTPKDALESAH